MTGKRHSRQCLQQQRTHRRRYPFSADTCLYKHFAKKGRERFRELYKQLLPYLEDDNGIPVLCRGIFLNDEGKALKRQVIYMYLANAIKPFEDGSSPLKVPKSVFFRYLADPAHSNLNVSERSLQAAVNKLITIIG